QPVFRGWMEVPGCCGRSREEAQGPCPGVLRAQEGYRQHSRQGCCRQGGRARSHQGAAGPVRPL
ncbi:hypothetical protein GGH97_006657, partial [Coemansia sp. RSA 475]